MMHDNLEENIFDLGNLNDVELVDNYIKIKDQLEEVKKKKFAIEQKALRIMEERGSTIIQGDAKELILDKNFLINQIKNLEGRIVDNKYFNFTIINNDNKINIFFDNKTLNLIGWQTEDIYQNLVITFIYGVKLNQKIDQNIFKLPEKN